MKAASSLARHSPHQPRPVRWQRPDGMVFRNLLRRASSSGPPSKLNRRAGVGIGQRAGTVHANIVRAELRRQGSREGDPRALGVDVDKTAPPWARTRCRTLLRWLQGRAARPWTGHSLATPTSGSRARGVAEQGGLQRVDRRHAAELERKSQLTGQDLQRPVDARLASRAGTE